MRDQELKDYLNDIKIHAQTVIDINFSKRERLISVLFKLEEFVIYANDLSPAKKSTILELIGKLKSEIILEKTRLGRLEDSWSRINKLIEGTAMSVSKPLVAVQKEFNRILENSIGLHKRLTGEKNEKQLEDKSDINQEAKSDDDLNADSE